MAEFDKERAIARYTDLMRLIRVGAYQERDVDGSYGADGIEKGVDELDYRTAQQGLEFTYHKESETYTLEPISAESKAAFLHVNVDRLVSILAEAAQYLTSLPYDSALERSARTGLMQRIEEAIRDSYRVPVVKQESEA